MKISFDTSAKIAGIGLVPWTRLGPEMWFDNYKIASLYGWDMQDVPGAPEVFALSDSDYGMPELSRLNTESLLKAPEFQRMLTDKLSGYSFITYKPVKVPKALKDAGLKFLFVDQDLATKLENKIEFRELFKDALPFPHYHIVSREDLVADDATLRALLKGRPAVILQDEMLSGGKGTFVVRTTDDLAYVLESLKRVHASRRLVVSEYIEGGRERTVQACVTKYGTFVGPLQKQIVGHPLLANLKVPEGDRFCGAEISTDDKLSDKYEEIRAYAMLIGERIQALGYKGIFGLDCLVDDEGKAYVLEVNARITGVTPLLTKLYREGQDIPFYLLHLLELAGIDYQIDDFSVSDTPLEGSLLVLHAHEPYTAQIIDCPSSGLYDLKGLGLTAKQYRLSSDRADQLLVQQYTPPGFKLKPGARLMMAYTNRRVLDSSDALLPETDRAVKGLLAQVAVKGVEND